MDAKGSGVMAGAQEGEETRNIMAANAGAMTLVREYRRGNWTLPETMLLIEAKKRVHDDRHPADQGLARWRWVEDYCWRAGCQRSQNQCNDRWDNLMRDYKKVRAYEHAGVAGRGGAPSYWEMARAERKERCLPSNLLREIYEGMREIIESRRMSCGGAGVLFLGAPATTNTNPVDIPMQASPLAQVLPRPLDQETHCTSESPERKRLRPSLDGLPGSSTAATASGHGDHHQEPQGDQSSDDEEEDGLNGAIGRCAAILSGALESREAAEERRHREVMAVEERRNLARQTRREAGEQCMAGLAVAVSQLAGSMLALAAKRKGPAAPK
ncbi:trihelix transcription factor ASR3-like [Lolium rigidum]|uniref:trihelix transcription factor ASR3-like n=1 Tax=Lolium rigidum TaxID=89674 RepID=UPI001F5E2096|nr:trihelix transcription factor ASR3-like [Lolium rigidum]XP_051179150.1 trihelix transcription factor ASR3-like [Lolium perenne]